MWAKSLRDMLLIKNRPFTRSKLLRDDKILWTIWSVFNELDSIFKMKTNMFGRNLCLIVILLRSIINSCMSYQINGVNLCYIYARILLLEVTNRRKLEPLGTNFGQLKRDGKRIHKLLKTKILIKHQGSNL